ncbi:MAG: hypothetical protein N4A62_19140 [Marinisporobacter sp.]|jgi:hypothetical protein|nr:hypothetical protein [Marinisporobacter sp.]
MDMGFCIILSKYRLYQGLALLCSLYQFIDNFNLFTLCMDDDTFEVLQKMNWKNVYIIHVNEIENEELIIIKKQRKLNEYCWTLKPVFLQYVFINYTKINRITYLDADLYFFGDPTLIFENQKYCSILLSRHNLYIPNIKLECKELERLLGKYNSGFISFKRDNNTYNCLKWWKDRCIEWCYDRVEEGKFGDQVYLDCMPSEFLGICDIETPGVNIGHWNYCKYKFSIQNNKVYIDDFRLIFYHFSGFRVLKNHQYILEHEIDKTQIPMIYEIYNHVINDVIGTVEKVVPNFNGFTT